MSSWKNSSMMEATIRLAKYGVHLIPQDTGKYQVVRRETWYTKYDWLDPGEVGRVIKEIILDGVPDSTVSLLLDILGVLAIPSRESIIRGVLESPGPSRIVVPGPNLPGLLLELTERQIPLRGIPWLNGKDSVYHIAMADYQDTRVDLVYSDGTRQTVVDNGEVQDVFLVPAEPQDVVDYCPGDPGEEFMTIPLRLLKGPLEELVMERLSEILVGTGQGP